MRLVLALETSSLTRVVAVGDGQHPRVQRASHRDDPAYTGFGALVAETLTAAGATFGDVGTIAVDVGPGGLSSIRSAVAYANGLAFSLGVPIYPVSSLELMAIAARRVHPGPVLSLKPAHGGNVFAGLFADGQSAERVRETGMFCSRKGEIGEAELTQPAQALHCGHIEQPRLSPIEFDEVMNRIEYSLQFRSP